MQRPLPAILFPACSDGGGASAKAQGVDPNETPKVELFDGVNN